MDVDLMLFYLLMIRRMHYGVTLQSTECFMIQLVMKLLIMLEVRLN